MIRLKTWWHVQHRHHANQACDSECFYSGMLIHLMGEVTYTMGSLYGCISSYRTLSDLSRPTLCTCKLFVITGFCYSVVKSLSSYLVSCPFIEGSRLHIPTRSLMLMFLVSRQRCQIPFLIYALNFYRTPRVWKICIFVSLFLWFSPSHCDTS